MDKGRTYVRTMTVLIRVNTGAPTWWMPNLKARFTGRIFLIEMGWLRACLQLGFGTGKHDELSPSDSGGSNA